MMVVNVCIHVWYNKSAALISRFSVDWYLQVEKIQDEIRQYILKRLHGVFHRNIQFLLVPLISVITKSIIR